jgi:hypothetical protein
MPSRTPIRRLQRSVYEHDAAPGGSGGEDGRFHQKYWCPTLNPPNAQGMDHDTTGGEASGCTEGQDEGSRNKADETTARRRPVHPAACDIEQEHTGEARARHKPERTNERQRKIVPPQPREEQERADDGRHHYPPAHVALSEGSPLPCHEAS